MHGWSGGPSWPASLEAGKNNPCCFFPADHTEFRVIDGESMCSTVTPDAHVAGEIRGPTMGGYAGVSLETTEAGTILLGGCTVW